MASIDQRKTLAFTVLVTIGFSLFYWGFAHKFNGLLDKYAIFLLLLALAFFFIKPKIERKIESSVVKSVLTMIMAISLGFSINLVISKFVDGLWWLYIIGGVLLYTYAEEASDWLS